MEKVRHVALKARNRAPAPVKPSARDSRGEEEEEEEEGVKTLAGMERKNMVCRKYI